ncbi:alpha/beta hydrolase [Photobacterium japonica]|uniref:alpha/beta hydrolase n=1 Tax=Photobacterium japonica TaxID=2910235 RepID=UPI003D13E0F5
MFDLRGKQIDPRRESFDPRIKQYDPHRMVVLPDVAIPQLNKTRTVRIYLPVDYFTVQRHYPVIYMHDGQNVFEPQLCISAMSWQAGEYLDALQHNSDFAGAIIVAVDCSPEREQFGRRDEYSPWPYEAQATLAHWPEALVPQGGDGNAYCRFIVETLKPYIDLTYRTLPQREHTTIAGSSMGGLISLYALLTYPETFANAGVFSPAFWFAETAMKTLIAATSHEHLAQWPLTVYMDIGTEESSGHAGFPALYHDLAVDIAKQLHTFGPVVQCRFDVDPGGIHSESAWARRFPVFIDHCVLRMA